MSNVWVKTPLALINASEICTIERNCLLRMDHGTSKGINLYPSDTEATDTMTESLLREIARPTENRAVIVEFSPARGLWSCRRIVE